ncbi:MarR family winged helix-turn-helix transcriptional regulator [Amycolatopsis sp. cmx-4-68]|uniref:MarR family winged helix-turn-helix transcriptional regulator n=1 Tax=Amycolatopsis sp. cmx-4-68 TaxID=2790938 RepID=UPI00397808F8
MSQEQILQPVDESVGYALKKASALLRSAMDQALRPLDLTVPQYACLEVLRQRPGLSGSELARAVFVSRQSMNLVLKGLEDRGLLTRPPVPAHGKALPTELTPAGRERLLAASRALSVVENRMLAALTPSARRRLCADLASIATALSDETGSGEI